MDYLGTRTDANGNTIHSFVNYGGDKYNTTGVAGVVQPSYINDIMSKAQANSSANMAWSAHQASLQMQFQRQMQQLAMDFNAKEAAKNRDWQEYMSNSAHQREIADLKAAGLNPVLSASGGNGAAVTSGATAAAAQGATGASGQIDNSSNQAITSLLGAWISSLTALENQRVSAQSNEAIADKYNAFYKWQTEVNDQRERWATEFNAQVSQLLENNRNLTNLEITKIQAAQSGINAKINAGGLTSAAQINGAWQSALENTKYEHEIYLRENYPQTEVGAASAIVQKGSRLLDDVLGISDFERGFRHGSSGGNRSSAKGQK